jgi:hypothetical protein
VTIPVRQQAQCPLRVHFLPIHRRFRMVDVCFCPVSAEAGCPGQERCVWPDSCDSNSHTEARNHSRRTRRLSMGCDQADAAVQAAWATRQSPAVFRRECLTPMLAEDAIGKSLLIFRNNVKPRRQKYSPSVFRKFMITLSPSRLRQGRIAIVTDVRRRDAVDARRLSALARRRKHPRGRPSRVVLIPRRCRAIAYG